ncbi:hypothetical protein [Bacillus phage vB_BceM_Bc431v3]|uniref:Uncharacterized protein n=2 Tax=Caeruleovirus TaxID=1911929 RepID=A0A140HLP4_9CAUD|nr:hypothetical protein K201_gp104 [Bacillus phage vB_BceM_Bc431v3]YP_009285395.1 hypothetical protein Blue_083 [Bacillus phage Deep Blue]AFQ96412.1 hypothetical protein [Bacillus phage vB_BceM_Bc431v3]AMO25906.1 hypothetical protein Blue_083 [Bacillus phage Deep Blue]
MWFNTDSEYRYEKQMKFIDHLVLQEIRDRKKIDINMEQLYVVLTVLHDFRVVD